MDKIEKQLEAIERRNRRVEEDKAWETSRTRRASIAGLTYLVVMAYLVLIDNEDPYINALVPVVGYLLSTLLLPYIKERWSKRYKRAHSL